MEDEGKAPKPFRKRQAGPKAQKKKKKEAGDEQQDLTAQQRNPKAFSYQSVNKVVKAVRRTLDIKEKRHHIPLVDRTPVEPPPVMVAVVGPPKTGKTTLINCLIKNFTRQKLSAVQGPVTIVSGKQRRLTFMECANDINSMIDLAKVADLVLLLVDASFGFEMEIFEFLNICQVHGFPKIMGVLTHLDMFRNNKVLRKTKKRLKHRFWTEVYQGAKLFYLSGMVNGEYQRTEVHNLGRFISVMKFRPLQWRTSHPYMVADRMEDVTDPEAIRQNAKTDRSVCLYGYVRGTHFKNNSFVHIPGCGDYAIQDMSFLPDPCPLPEQLKKRSLNEKERLIYAPMSGVGGIVYDKDAVYIELGGSHSMRTQEEEQVASNDLVASMIDTQQTLDEKIASSELRMFTEAAPITSEDTPITSEDTPITSEDTPITSEDTPITSEATPGSPREELVRDASGRVRRRAVFSTRDSDGDGDSDGESESEPEEGSDEEDEVNLSGKDPEPPTKKTKASLVDLAFADSDDDLEGRDDSFKLFSADERSPKVTSKTKVTSITKMTSKTKVTPKTKATSKTSSDDEEETSGSEDNMDTGSDSDSESDSDSGSDSEEEDITPLKKSKRGLNIKAPGMNGSKSSKKTNQVDKPTKQKTKVKINETTSTLISSKTKRGRVESGHSGDSGSDEDSEVDEEEDESEAEEEDEEGDESEVEEGGEEDWGSGEESDQMEAEGESGEDADEDDLGDFGDEEETGQLKWKDGLVEKAAEAFRRRQQLAPNLGKLIYGNYDLGANGEGQDEEEEEDNDLGGLFKVTSGKRKKGREARLEADGCDCSRSEPERGQSWDMEQVIADIRDCFVTGKWESGEDAQTLLDVDDELYGDFEDLETGQKHEAKAEAEEEDGVKSDGEGQDGADAGPAVRKTSQEKRLEKKKRIKAMFDQQYDDKDGGGNHYDEWKAETERQSTMNREEFQALDDQQRVAYEGFRPGLYVRVQVNRVPHEFVSHFDAAYPVILGGLLSAEQNVGYVQVRLKKHRWHKRILKTRDPLVVSLGWRRFQTVALYSIQDHNGRNRLLKYTPEHLHCHATFWGPITPQGSGVLAVQSVQANTPDFRVSATGVVLELDKSKQILKKLKLTGTPFKIYKKTAFIQGMFTSGLEVAKFEGSSLRTVSGVRGQIKKAVKEGTPGAFRATFEDRILLSDIVFVRTWFPVEVPQFYNPVTSLLLSASQRQAWQGMKTAGQLRREQGVRREAQQDSIYKAPERRTRVTRPLLIPKDLQRNLPFAHKPKVARKVNDAIQSKRVAVVREPKERKIAELMKMMRTLNEEKMKQRRATMRQRAETHQKQMGKVEERREEKHKEVKKKIYRVLGKMEKRDRFKHT